MHRDNDVLSLNLPIVFRKDKHFALRGVSVHVLHIVIEYIPLKAEARDRGVANDLTNLIHLRNPPAFLGTRNTRDTQSSPQRPIQKVYLHRLS